MINDHLSVFIKAIRMYSRQCGHNLAVQIAALPDRQRHAVAYHYVAGLPYDAVADILGGTADAARRAAADGINSLRRNLPTHARTHR